ncbi:MAG: alpha/beta hydrolase [Sulfuricurvum sp.]|uniref:alpha/beta hydrolase n=1 Tax=Sulfuricurvum sp. TaxID=2025608 RepID=UPI0025D2D5CF|nr:alpha/beta hydrolase [Sulfuricurvum sp.]MBV5320304.1 alpha/beta hydrolase [Sulfuricurvum sp.]
MRVYIEGDGFAWKTRSKLSDNPTPINPLAAKLMAADPTRCKVYIARPCQYTNDSKCHSEYWGSRRFSREIIDSYQDALNQIKKSNGIEQFDIIGYSGGGAIAVLSAEGRHDVRHIITVAGNLDTDGWVAYHALSPLEGSLNPADKADAVSNIPQTHFVGGKDTVVPIDMFQSYSKRVSKPNRLRNVICEECTHSDGWIERWREWIVQINDREK